MDFGVYRLTEEAVTEEQLRRLSEELKTAFTEVGFVFLKNTGISAEEVRPANSIRVTRSFCKVLSSLLCVCWDRWTMLWTYRESSSCSQMSGNNPSAGKALPSIPTTAGFLWRLRGMTENMNTLTPVCALYRFYNNTNAFQVESTSTWRPEGGIQHCFTSP